MYPDQTTTGPTSTNDPVAPPASETLEPSTLQPVTLPEPVILPETLPVAIPEPVTEPAPEVIQPATPVNAPEQVITEPPTVPVAPSEPISPRETLEPSTLQPETIPAPSQVEPAASPEPQPSTIIPQPQTTPTFDVNSLNDEQLKAASALYAKKNQKALSQKGVEKRRAIASQNISEITSFIAGHSPASNRTIARALNLPPRRVQHYMQILTHNGTVTATGWGASRQYFKK